MISDERRRDLEASSNPDEEHTWASDPRMARGSTDARREPVAARHTNLTVTTTLLERPAQGRRSVMDEGLLAETIGLRADGGDLIPAYLARPMGPGPFTGVVVIHHNPGFVEPTREITRRFAAHGYSAICPNLHHREAPNAASPAEASAAVRAAGGVPDDRCVGDVAAASAYLRDLRSNNGKIGVIGYCSGGRQSYLVACQLPFEAAIDCYGGRVAPAERNAGEVPPVDLTAGLNCPLLGLFGAEDQNPSPEETARIEAALKEHDKEFEFHTLENAGHAFFAVDRPNYRVDASARGWELVWDFFGRHLAGDRS
jgi:carboxymethylenebutenolidase